MTDSDFKLNKRTSAITITAYVSFKTILWRTLEESIRIQSFSEKEAWCSRDDSTPPTTTPFC